MSYIGSSAAPLPVAFSGPQSEGFDGGTATFTLSRSVAKVTDIEVVINNVPQSPYDGSYSVSGSTLTTSETVSAGTKNVIVKYRDVSLGSLTPLNGSIDKIKLDVASLDGTGAAQMPVGTTAQRPAMPQSGMYRLNSTTGKPEWFSAANNAWLAFNQSATYGADFLVVAGGGGGGGSQSGGIRGAGGGGAGGYRSSLGSSGGGASAESAITFMVGTAYNVIVGAGGAGGAADLQGAAGNDSTLWTITAIAGGSGGAVNSVGGNGGSGGGSGNYNASASVGTSGQGFGGSASGSNGGSYIGGAGGGAGSAAVATTPGTGVTSSISGSSVTRSNGGGLSSGGGGVSASANTGDGGQGGKGTSTAPGGNGGSGVVVIRYAGAQQGTGGTVTFVGGYTIHTFTSSGTFTA